MSVFVFFLLFVVGVVSVACRCFGCVCVLLCGLLCCVFVCSLSLHWRVRFVLSLLLWCVLVVVVVWLCCVVLCAVAVCFVL